ncbi:hypothetical protein L3V79_09130 [Thiotrichales bacterium 19S9-12]|nr:hypothetical protein [Thiotrichales bacterium 19S9-11]MCF6812520.1 hypothetical protein [Thiotrichales bacterium 19S9-12]
MTPDKKRSTKQNAKDVKINLSLMVILLSGFFTFSIGLEYFSFKYLLAIYVIVNAGFVYLIFIIRNKWLKNFKPYHTVQTQIFESHRTNNTNEKIDDLYHPCSINVQSPYYLFRD